MIETLAIAGLVPAGSLLTSLVMVWRRRVCAPSAKPAQPRATVKASPELLRTPLVMGVHTLPTRGPHKVGGISDTLIARTAPAPTYRPELNEDIPF